MVYNNNRSGSKENCRSMVRVLAAQRKGINVVHINAQSLKNKIDQFRYIFTNSNVDVICVSETWFHPAFQNSLFDLNDYHLFRTDRIGHAGGVAIYVRNGVSAKIVLASKPGESIEFLFIEIFFNGNNNKKLLTGVVYRPNRRTDYDHLVDKLEEIALVYNDVIVCGDFNNNVLHDSLLESDLQSLGLTLVHKSIPTHYSNTTNTLIDLIFVSCSNKILLYDQLAAPMFSNHDLLFLTYEFQTFIPTYTYCYRDFRKLNHAALLEDVKEVDWNAIFYMIDVDDQVEYLVHNVSYLYDKHIPLKTKTVFSDKDPWIDVEVETLMVERDASYARWQKFKVTELHESYKRLRNKVNNLINYKKNFVF